MSTDKLNLRVKSNGDTVIDFMPVSFSEYIVKNVFSEEDRRRFEEDQERFNQGPMKGKVFCG